MRNLKKFLALVLAMIMVVGSTAMVSADFTDVEADSNYAAAINDLAVKGIIKGTTETTFGPAQAVTRKQMAIFVARIMTGEVESDDIWANGLVPFTDVTDYKGAIQHAWVNGVINGKSDTIFAPEDGIKYIEALKMLVCALGYGVDADGKALSWPNGYYREAVALGLTDNISTVTDLEQALTREETAQLIYNAIYADRADGSPCFAAENFDISTADNTDLFVISATPKQYHSLDIIVTNTSSQGDKDTVYVGVQSLVGGVPTGKMYYIPAADLGIADADVENYFNYAVELVNFNAETKEFGRAILGDAPKVVLNDEVVNSGIRLTIDGVHYRAIGSTLESTLYNELVIYSGTDVAATATTLHTSSDGVYVYDVFGDVVAYRLSSAANSVEPIYYEIATGARLNYRTILSKYGYTYNHGAMSVANLLNKAYSLSLFDDDRDGVYERAIYNPTFMGVYYTYNSAGKTYDGLINALYNELNGDQVAGSIVANNETAEVTYVGVNAPAKGAIYVYSYNPQTKTVTVYDTLTMQTGTVNKVTYNGWNTENTRIAGVTIDNTAYKVYYFNGVNNSLVNFWNTGAADSFVGVAPATLGAFVVERLSARYNPDPDNPGSYDVTDVAAQAFLESHKSYSEVEDKYFDVTVVGQDIAFYAYGEYVIMADFVERTFRDSFTVIEYPREFYYEGLYLDMFVGTEYKEMAHVVAMNGFDITAYKTYDWDFADFLNERKLHYPGTIYASTYKYEDSYILADMLDSYADFAAIEEFKDVRAADETNVSAIANNGTVTWNGSATTGRIDFAKGVSTNATATKKLYTYNDTVWYFIDNATPGVTGKTTTVTQFVGDADDHEIVFDANTQIWADNFGRKEGYATIIFVIDAVSHDFTSTLDKTTYVMTSSAPQVADVGSASHFGLDGYTGYYYMYTGAHYSLDNGAAVNAIYSTYKLDRMSIYEIDENGVVIGAKATGGFINELTGDLFDGSALTTTLDSETYNICDVDNNGQITYFDLREYFANETTLPEVADNDYLYSGGTATGKYGDVIDLQSATAADAIYDEIALTTELVSVVKIGANYDIDFVADDTHDEVVKNIVVITWPGTLNGLGVVEGDAAVRVLEKSTAILRLSSAKFADDDIAVFIVNPIDGATFAANTNA